MTEQPCPTRAPSSRSRLVIAALERQLELVTGGRSVREAFWVCEYDAGMGSGTFGDVQRLENGNTFITYSNRGTIIEVDSAKNILQQFTTDPLGYVVFRESLYGPPPR